jgi:hypothetical protein
MRAIPTNRPNDALRKLTIRLKVGVDILILMSSPQTAWE